MPARAPERGDDDDDVFAAPPPKRPTMDASFFDADRACTSAAIADADADANVNDPSSELDAKRVRQLVLAFERAYAENVKQRAKHADEPARFAESEIELDCEIKALGQLASAPELYAELVRLNVME